jgi:hypothetical protein
MKTQCLLKRNEYHTTAWIDSEVTKLGLLVEITELGGLWEIVEIYPHRSTPRQQLAANNSFSRTYPIEMTKPNNHIDGARCKESLWRMKWLCAFATAAAAAASTWSTGASARRCREPPGAWGRRLGRDCSTSEAIGLRRSNSSTWSRLPLWRPRARLPLVLPPSLASPKQSGKTPAGPPNRHSCHARLSGLQP